MFSQEHPLDADAPPIRPRVVFRDAPRHRNGQHLEKHFSGEHRIGPSERAVHEPSNTFQVSTQKQTDLIRKWDPLDPGAQDASLPSHSKASQMTLGSQTTAVNYTREFACKESSDVMRKFNLLC